MPIKLAIRDGDDLKEVCVRTLASASASVAGLIASRDDDETRILVANLLATPASSPLLW
jgi:hypothetical protein